MESLTNRRFFRRYGNEGWHLVKHNIAMTVFEFKKDTSKKMRYALDYNTKPDDEYLTIFEDDNWEYIGSSTGWVLWRKQYETERPDIHTDNQSLMDKNSRQLRFLILIAALQIPILIMNIRNLNNVGHPSVLSAILCVYLAIIGMLGYGIVRLFLSNRLLKREGRR